MKNEVNLRFFTLAIGVAIAHFVSGILIITGGKSVAKTVPLALLGDLCDNVYVLGTSLIVASIFAVWAFLGERSRLKTLLMLAPQQFILALSLLSAMVAIITGTYSDGYVPVGGWLFISADQIWLITMCFWHTIEYGAIFSSIDRTEL